MPPKNQSRTAKTRAAGGGGQMWDCWSSLVRRVLFHDVPSSVVHRATEGGRGTRSEVGKWKSGWEGKRRRNRGEELAKVRSVLMNNKHGPR
eukprot:364798-Chlamydomonas_euryale.AAC.17